MSTPTATIIVPPDGVAHAATLFTRHVVHADDVGPFRIAAVHRRGGPSIAPAAFPPGDLPLEVLSGNADADRRPRR
jgi:hypothetical protein